jgi:hypothetical protein
MHKSYKRKKSCKKTRKIYNKVGGEDGPSGDLISSQITEINTKITSLNNSINSIIDEIPVFIGYKLISFYPTQGSNPNGRYINTIPLYVKSNIDSDTFLKIIGDRGNRNRNTNGYGWETEPFTNIYEPVNLVDLKAVYHSLPNVRGLPLKLISDNIICYFDEEDRLLFQTLNKENIKKLQIKYNNLFARPDPNNIKVFENPMKNY